jgi:LacI family transcriptional regulator
MEKRITIKDIADKLGISANTVAKAINGKPRISEELRQKVLDTAKEMGYRQNKFASALARNAILFGIIYPQEPVEFYAYLRKGIDKGLSDLIDYKVTGVFQPVKDLNSVEETRTAIEELCRKNVDGILLSPGFHTEEYRDAVANAVANGIPVLYIVNELFYTGSLGGVRMDGRVAGSLAAEFLSFCLGEGGNVAVFTCNKDILIQKECIGGFVEEAERDGLKVKGIFETQDNKEIAYALTEKVLRELPDVRGIYVSSSNSVGVCSCLEQNGRQKDVFVIGQDLFPELVEKLKVRSLKATLFQNPFEQGRRAVRMLYGHLTGEEMYNSEVKITPQLVLTSNLESYSHYIKCDE